MDDIEYYKNENETLKQLLQQSNEKYSNELE